MCVGQLTLQVCRSIDQIAQALSVVFEHGHGSFNEQFIFGLFILKGLQPHRTGVTKVLQRLFVGENLLRVFLHLIELLDFVLRIDMTK